METTVTSTSSSTSAKYEPTPCTSTSFLPSSTSNDCSYDPESSWAAPQRACYGSSSPVASSPTSFEQELSWDAAPSTSNESTASSSEPAPSTSFVTEEFTPEYLQRKLYFLVDELKKMHSKLPESYQMRIPYELLTGLAHSLLNDTLFEIVKGLMEIQHVTERHLLELRDQVEQEYQQEVEDWMIKITDPEELGHILALMKIKHTKKLRETDRKIIAHLDQKVKDQQSTLERAGVPGFYVTENHKEIKIQMHLLDFILRLSRMKYPFSR